MIRIIIAIFVPFQLVCIIFLLLPILQNNSDIKGLSVSTIQRNEFITTPSADLKYFYEPKRLQTIRETIPTNSSYTINADSLHERYDYPEFKSPRVFRIITLGDSFTFGQGVNTKDNWTEILEDTLNSKELCSTGLKFEVINLGVKGYDKQYAVERYKRRGVKYSPDLILWLDANFSRRVEEIYGEFNKAKLSQTKGEISSSHFLELEQSVREKYEPEELFQLQKDSILSLSEYYKGKLVLLVYPMIPKEHKTVMKSIVSERPGTYYHDRFRFFPGVDYLFPDGHPNENGHKIIAEDALEYLIEQRLLPACR